MAQIVLTAAQTTLVLNGTIIGDMGEGDYITLTPVNPLTSRVNSSNGGVNIAGRLDGGQHDMVVRVQKYSAADVFLNNARNQAAPVVFDGSAKETFTRDGVESVESYILESGSITAQPTNTKNNTDGNAMMEYTIAFRNATRNL